MNFLSHFYLDKAENNHYYNAGLTLPDLIGFHKGRARITEKNLLQLIDGDNYHLFNGMISHLKLDKRFHTSDFFKNSIVNLQNICKESTGIHIHNFTAHIVIEMLIDKFIIETNEGIVTEFYNVFNNISIEAILFYLKDIRNINPESLGELLKNFYNSNLIFSYADIDSIIEIAERVSVKYAALEIVSLQEMYKPINDFFQSEIGSIKSYLEKLRVSTFNVMSIS